jgi:hypothetical protein
MLGEHGIRLMRIPRSMLGIQPDTVIAKVSRERGIEGNGRTEAAHAGNFTGAEFGEDFGFSHGG